MNQTLTKQRDDRYSIDIVIPEGIEVSYDNNLLKIKGEKGEIIRKFFNPHIEVEIKEGKIHISFKGKKFTRKIKALMHTWRAHIRNMFKGVKEGYEYRLRIFYTHFPMSVKVEGNKVVISNFLGEKGNRYADILEGVSVDIKGEEIIVRGVDKEKVGQTAANIEQATKNKGGRDPRKFADGIYIIHKDK